jgi:hypothetical protein
MRFRLRGLRRLRDHGLRRRETLRVRPNLEILEARLVPSVDSVQTNLVSDISGLAFKHDVFSPCVWAGEETCLESGHSPDNRREGAPVRVVYR